MWPYQKWTCRIGLVLDLFILGSLGIFHRGIGLPSPAPLPWSRHSETLPQLLIDAWDQVLFSKLGTPKLTNYQFPQQNCHKLGYHRVSLYNFQALPRRAAFSSWRSTICFWMFLENLAVKKTISSYPSVPSFGMVSVCRREIPRELWNHKEAIGKKQWSLGK